MALIEKNNNIVCAGAALCWPGDVNGAISREQSPIIVQLVSACESAGTVTVVFGMFF